MKLNRSSAHCGKRYMFPGALLFGLVSVLASAQAADEVTSAAAPTAKETVTEELIRLLAEHNALSADDAQKLIKRLQDEQAQSSTAPAPVAGTPVAPSAPAATAAAPPADPKGRVRVIYLPETDKEKIRNEIKDDVIATAKSQNWALPNTFPQWLKQVHLDGDLRLRQEFDLYDSGNSNLFIDYTTINSGSPLDLNQTGSNPVPPPLLDTTVNREYPRVSLHLGVGADVADNLSTYVRFATGNTNNPVSTNQTLGNEFNKYSLTVDRAVVKYAPFHNVDLDLLGGRMANPFQGTSMMWYWDLGFDGFAAKYRYHLNDDIVPYATAGAFSVENTALSFPQYSPTKIGSRDKWLYAMQLGVDWRSSPLLTGKAGVAFYDYYHLEGEESDPCQATASSTPCDTDDSAASFVQKGNTLFAIRDIVIAEPTGGSTVEPDYQYFGLASPFRIWDGVINLDYDAHGPLHFVFDAEVANNVAFKKTRVLNVSAFSGGPANNLGSCPTGQNCPYQGGAMAYFFQGKFGYPIIAERGQWSVQGAYRHVESDSLVDAFNDPDFFLGGTNNKGYQIIGSLGIAHNSWLSARWFSGTEVSGPPLAIDVIQLDLNTRW